MYKRILLLGAFFVLLGFSVFPKSHLKTVAEQQQVLQAQLFKYEKQFSLEEYWIDVQVKHHGTMKDPTGAWCVTYFDDNGAHIEIMDEDDMPASLPPAERDRFQLHILQHEVLHVYMTSKGVPEEFQDSIIHLFQQYLKET